MRRCLAPWTVLSGLGYMPTGCNSSGPPHEVTRVQVDAPTVHLRGDWAQQIADSGVTGTFVLWEPDSGRLQASDTTRAQQGFLPASTFKVFNSLVALHEAAVANTTETIPWDGVKRRSADWNEDQHMGQAIARSTVWWYQEVARRVGPARMQYWLDRVGYGNQTMGDSIHLFWLQGGLRITPLQQIQFMQALHDEELPFDGVHQRAVKKIVPGDSTDIWKLQGKTGWAIRVDEEYGWYVGWVERGGSTAYFATNIDMRNMEDVRKRHTLSYALLQRSGWLME